MKKILLIVFSALSFAVMADCPGLNTTFYMNQVTCFSACNGHGYALASGGSGNYTYSYVSSSYAVLPNQVNDSVYNLCSGSYYVIVNDVTAGCADTTSFFIGSPSQLAVITNGTTTICAGATASIFSTATAGTPAYAYSWSPMTGLNSPTVSSPVASPTVTTTYTVTVYDANGCQATATATVVVNPAPAITVNSSTICQGMSATLTATGASTYTWSPGGMSGASVMVTPTTTTTYTVSGTASGCTSTITATVTVNPVPVVSTSTSNASCGNCNGFAVATSNAPGIFYSWTGPNGFSATGSTITGLCPGMFTVTGNSMGCQSMPQNVIVGNSSPVAGTISSVTPATCGACDGSATVSVTGGTAPYTYLWSPAGITTQTATNLCQGTYIVQVTDANGCTINVTAVVPSSSNMTTTVSATSTSCNVCNGTANVSVSGGTGPYTYMWAPTPPSGQGTASISNLCAGNYTITVTDNSGCTISDLATINTAGQVFVTGNNGSSTCGACNGSVFLAAGGGTPPYLYDLSNGAPQQTNGNFTGVCPGTYLGTVTDMNGCSGTFTLFVTTTNSSNITVTNNIIHESGFGLQNGSIDLSVSGIAPPFTFLWSNGATTEDVYSLGAGMYSVTVTDSSGNCGTYYYTVSTVTTYAYITGTAYSDNNSNCVFDAGDFGLSGYMITASNGTNTYSGYTNTLGYYSIWVPSGGYTVTPSNTANLEAACTNSYAITVNSSSTVPNNNFSYVIPPIHDVCVYAWSSGIVPGFSGYYNVYLSNAGNQTANGSVYFVLPGILDYVSAYPAPSSISGDTIFWNYSGLIVSSSMSFSVIFNTPVAAPVGTVTTAFASASVSNGTDANPGCNIYTYTRIITGSYDPNDKTVSPSGSGINGDIPLTEDEFSYLIRFQNTGNGPAVNITVDDTLSSLLDPMSFQMLNASHNYVVEMLPGNVIRWHFDNIMLPDSNTNEAASHGHVQFKINKLNAPVAGQVVENKAYIYFDFNAPVITNTAVNTYNLAAAIEQQVSDNGKVSVYPNPFSDETTFLIRSEKVNETYTLEITDVLGKSVNKFRTNEKQFTVNRSGLQNGMYFYTITNNAGLVGMGKVIIK